MPSWVPRKSGHRALLCLMCCALFACGLGAGALLWAERTPVAHDIGWYRQTCFERAQELGEELKRGLDPFSLSWKERAFLLLELAWLRQLPVDLREEARHRPLVEAALEGLEECATEDPLYGSIGVICTSDFIRCHCRDNKELSLRANESMERALLSLRPLLESEREEAVWGVAAFQLVNDAYRLGRSRDVLSEASADVWDHHCLPAKEATGLTPAIMCFFVEMFGPDGLSWNGFFDSARLARSVPEFDEVDWFLLANTYGSTDGALVPEAKWAYVQARHRVKNRAFVSYCDTMFFPPMNVAIRFDSPWKPRPMWGRRKEQTPP